MSDKLRDRAQELIALMMDQIELNPSNYEHDDACRLNREAVEIHDIGVPLLTELSEALRALPAANPWLPIATAPKDGTVIDIWALNHLHYNKSPRRFVNCKWGPVTDWMGIEREDWQGLGGENNEATHWMPLPAQPENAE